MNWIIWIGIVVFNLLIGGFLTVLVYRLPLILQYQWKEEKNIFIENKNIFSSFFNLILPFSHCPNCKKMLNFLYSIPLCSYLILKGKCAYCKDKIHLRYPLIEAITLMSGIVISYRFSWSVQMMAALILTWGLIALSGIDFEYGLLPDVLIWPLLWLGLILNAFHIFINYKEAILGASIAYLSLWLISKTYKFFTKRDGIGGGDLKFFTLLGAWLGVYALINILLTASILGSIIGLIYLMKQKGNLQKAIPFGPYLAMAGWISLVLVHCPITRM